MLIPNDAGIIDLAAFGPATLCFLRLAYHTVIDKHVTLCGRL
jgi:hypothetical protein